MLCTFDGSHEQGSQDVAVSFKTLRSENCNLIIYQNMPKPHNSKIIDKESWLHQVRLRPVIDGGGQDRFETVYLSHV